MCALKATHVCKSRPEVIALARTINIFTQCIHGIGIIGREIIKYTVIYGVYLRF
jgi:hypothetical protein